jgi:hypothetical protein
LIGAKVAANKIKRIRSYLLTSRRPKNPTSTDLHTMTNIFRKIKLEKNKMWSKAKEEAAITIEKILFDNIITISHFSTAMNDFLLKLKLITL